MNSLRILFVFSIVTLGAVNGSVAQPSKPVVLMLLLDGGGLEALQQSVRDELSLLLDRHRLSTIPNFRFSSETFSERIEEIRRLATANGAEVVIWLERAGNNAISLRIVATAPGRSMVRSVESGDTEGELVLAARDALEEIQVPLRTADPPPKARANAAQATPTGAGESSRAAETADPFSRRHRYTLTAGLNSTGGFGGTARSPILLGGTLCAGRRWSSGIFAELSLTVFGALSPKIPDGTLKTVGLRPGVAVGYLWQGRTLSVGPYLGLEIPWQTAEASLGRFRGTQRSWWNLRVVPGVDLRIRLHRRLRLLLRPGVGLLVFQQVFSMESSGGVIYQSPYFEWTAFLGLIIALS